ncbi:MAG: MarR family winged helix-turn-helix transcriptional regulator [Caldimonas sp.]
MTTPVAARAASVRASDPPKARLPIDDALFFKLIRVVNLMARPFSEQIGRANRITLNEWRVMLVLASHPGSAAREVALHSGLDKMSVSRAIAGLGRQRRIVRQVDPKDRRRTRLWLNATGQKVYERIGTPAAERERRLFSKVGATAQAQMGRTLDGLIETLLALDSEAE